MGAPSPATGRIHDEEFRRHFRRTLSTFATALGYYNGLFDAVYLRNHLASQFWFATIGAHFDIAVIDWCKVMGTNSEELHWKKAFDSGAHDSVRAGILAATGLSATEWKSYHEEILTYRNKAGAHVDPKVRIHDYPMLGPAQSAAGVVYGKLQELYRVSGTSIDLICKRASRGAQAAAEAYVQGRDID